MIQDLMDACGPSVDKSNIEVLSEMSQQMGGCQKGREMVIKLLYATLS